MNRALASLALVVGFHAAAGEDPRFEKAKARAEPVGGLGAFLEKYVGDCEGDKYASADCKKAAEKFRSQTSGRRYFMVVTEDAVNLSMGSVGPGDDFVLHLVPFFSAGDKAVTHGAPGRLDGNGNPVMPLIKVRGSAPPGQDVQTLARWASMRMFRLEVVFTPQGVWELKKKGGEKVTGVKGKLEAVLVKIGRSDEPIAFWSAR